MHMRPPMLDPRVVPGVLVGIGATALAGAFFVQHVLDVPPCYLCIWQRWPFAALVVIGAIAVVLPPEHALRRASFLLAALAAGAGAALAAYHVGVEQHWWQGTAACMPTDFGAAEDLASLRRQLTETDPVRCDEVAWSLGGLSLASLNVLLSAALCLYSLAAGLSRPATPRRASA